MRALRVGLGLAALFAGMPVLAQAAAAQSPAPTSASPVDPVALDRARQIVDVVFPASSRIEMIAGISQSITAQMRSAMPTANMDAGLRQIIDDYIQESIQSLRPLYERHAPLLADAMAHAYVREFSADELRDVLVFAKSPAGAHYLSRSSAIIADPDVAAANRAYFADAQIIVQAGQAQMRDRIAEYLLKHPAAAGKAAQ